MTLVIIESACVPNRDAGHDLVAVPGYNPNRCCPNDNPQNDWRFGYGLRLVEYITSVRHGYIQVGISYWAAVVFWCLMGESGGDGCMSRMRSGAKQRLYHIHT